LLIFDNNGDLVYLYKLRSDELTTGTHVIAWEGESIYGQKLATGVYFALIEYNNGKKTRIVKTAIVN
jgi:flagellar hook assembly protein FlgD